MTIHVIMDHVSMVLFSILLALLTGVPLGIVSYLYPYSRKLILRLVDLIQTTPALALLGIIMVFLGPGKATVITGLTLYSLLPIVRNTYLGLNEVSPHLKEAATGIGMSRFGRLIRVELPLASPIIFAGLRIAAVNAVGTAVFAAYVGGGGLGGSIYQGIRTSNLRLILMGTGILMVIAVFLDFFLGFAEKRLNRRTSV